MNELIENQRKINTKMNAHQWHHAHIELYLYAKFQLPAFFSF